MIKVNGNDVFKDNKFDWYSWSADVFQTPAELREAFDKLNLTGKRIVDLLAVGEALEEIGHEGVTGKEAVYIETYHLYILVFDDGDRCEIFFSETSSVRMSMNCFPKNLEDIEPLPYMASGERFISPCVGNKIIGMDIGILDTYPYLDFTESYGMELPDDLESYIWYFDLLLDNGLKIRFEAAWDNGDVYILDEYGNSYWKLDDSDREESA